MVSSCAYPKFLENKKNVGTRYIRSVLYISKKYTMNASHQITIMNRENPIQTTIITQSPIQRPEQPQAKTQSRRNATSVSLPKLCNCQRTKTVASNLKATKKAPFPVPFL